MKKIIKNIIIIIFLFLCTLIFTSVNWALQNFEFLNFDEILFQISTPLQSTETSILKSYAMGGLMTGIILTLLEFGILKLIYHFFSAQSTEISIKLWEKSFRFKIKNSILKTITTILVIILPILLVLYSLTKISIVDYIKKNYLNNSVDFFEKNYVDPRNVEITFPEKKRNLIYIYAESLETSFFDKEHGGINEDNALAPLDDLTNENTMFSNTDNRGGFYSYNGTNFTTGSLVSQTSGLPLKISADQILETTNKYKELLPGAYTLNDILTKEGYNQTFVLGSDKAFGSRDIYFKTHGNMKLFDYYYAMDIGKIPKDYNVWWGYEDSKVFEYAKEEATRLSNEGKPFNLTLLTTSTHHPDGYTEDTCSNPFQRHYSNAIYCSAEQINEFVRWAQQQSFYENTTIIIVGDHFTYKPKYIDDSNRTVYNLIINSAIEEQNSKNRKFSTMDMFPTTLAALGVTIEGEQLGLGVNLYSGKETMPEKYGIEKYDDILSYSSKFYLDNILTKKEG